jgi:hypothetical protein
VKNQVEKKESLGPGKILARLMGKGVMIREGNAVLQRPTGPTDSCIFTGFFWVWLTNHPYYGGSTTSKTLVYFNKTTQHYSAEGYLHTRCHENLKSHRYGILKVYHKKSLQTISIFSSQGQPQACPQHMKTSEDCIRENKYTKLLQICVST